MAMNLKKILIHSLVFIIIFLPLTVWLVFESCYFDRFYPNIKIVGIDFGGIRLQEGLNYLNKLVFKAASENKIIAFTVNNQKFDLSLADLKLTYDTKETAKNAFLFARNGGIRNRFREKFTLLKQPVNFSLVFDIDEKTLDSFLATVSAKIEKPEKLPEIAVVGVGKSKEIEIKKGAAGSRLDKTAAKKSLLSNLSNVSYLSIPLHLNEVAISLTEEEISNTKKRAESVLFKQITLKIEDKQSLILRNKTFQINGESIVSFLDFKNGFKDGVIRDFLKEIVKSVDRGPQDALFQFENNRVVVFKPSLPGVKIKIDDSLHLIKETIKRLETGGKDKEELNLAADFVQPKIKTEEVNDLGIKELLGRGKSSFRGSIGSRVHNIGLASQKINGILVSPGETFSFNQAVGDISQETGYQTAYIIKDGRTTLGDGGGVCQVSTTFFRAILNAGLPVIERHYHSYRVYYYEQDAKVGLDATVFDPTADLKFKNDTPGYVLIQNQFDPKKLTLIFDLYGTSDGRKAEISNQKVWDITPAPPDLYIDDPTLPNGTIKQIDFKASGAKASFDWKVTRGNEIINQKTFSSVYKPWQAVYLKAFANTPSL